MRNFAINNKYLYDRMSFIKKKHRYQQNIKENECAIVAFIENRNMEVLL